VAFTATVATTTKAVFMNLLVSVPGSKQSIIDRVASSNRKTCPRAYTLAGQISFPSRDSFFLKREMYCKLAFPPEAIGHYSVPKQIIGTVIKNAH
jgi:hypothetical protein